MKRNIIQAKVLSAILAATVAFSSAPVVAAPVNQESAAEINVQVEEVTDSNTTNEAESQDEGDLAGNDAKEALKEDSLKEDSLKEDSLKDSVSSNQLALNKQLVFQQGGAWELDHTEVKEKYDEAEAQEVFDKLEKEGINTVRDASVHGDKASIYDSSYDPRALGLVTSIKDQGRLGLCWDYSALSTIESSLLYNGVTDNTVDLSELHTAYFYYVDHPYYKYDNFLEFCNYGGSAVNVINMAFDGIGPVTEQQVPMVEVDENTTVDESYKYQHAYELDTAYKIDLVNDAQHMAAAKMLIQETGGIMASYFSFDWFYKDDVGVADDTAFYDGYWYDDLGTNHAIEIVGWDDNFPRENFSDHISGYTADGDYIDEDLPLPPADGAWLVKNSWGTRNYYSKDPASGYLWISYYEGSLNSHSSYSVEFVPNGTVIRDLAIANNNMALRPGESAALDVTITPATAPKKVKYESLNNKVSVDANGVVTALDYGQGMVKVSAERDEGITKTASISVYTDGITLAPDPYIGTIFKKGDMKQALVPCFSNGKTAYSYGVLNNSFTWSSSNTNVADVTTDGKIIAKKDGVSTITVSFTNSAYTNGKTLTASYDVMVGAPSSFSKGGATFKKNSDGTYTYAKAPASASVTIPSSVKVQNLSVKVTKISKDAFKNNKKIKKVVIPSTITSIGDRAFYGCKNLKSITFKTSKLTKVGKSAFAKINKKAVIKVPKSKKSKYTKLLKGKVQKGVKIK